MVRAGNKYYVYALSAKKVSGQDGDFDPSDIFYVGKGTGLRWTQHFREAQKQLQSGSQTSNKVKQIQKILEQHGDSDFRAEDYAYIVSANLSNEEALRQEALTIELFRKAGIPLTNMVSGHHSSNLFKSAEEARLYYSAQPIDVDLVRTADIAKYLPGAEFEDRVLTIAVRGSGEDMNLYEDIYLCEDDEGYFDPISPDWVPVVSHMEDGEIRPGWNPDSPWDEDVARERARHYWSVGAEAAEILREIAADDRLNLVLVISDPRAGQSAIRYAWTVDPDGSWLDYGNKIGFPLGESIDFHLATMPRSRDSKHSIFKNFVSGICFADFTHSFAEQSEVSFSDKLDRIE